MPTAEDMGTTMPGMITIIMAMDTGMGTVDPLGVRPTQRRNGGRIATG
jgi:hypothetical protein